MCSNVSGVQSSSVHVYEESKFNVVLGPLDPLKNINVYLWPLADDFQDLWNEGIHVYDALKKEIFQLHMILL
jgi:hypothetical protein